MFWFIGRNFSVKTWQFSIKIFNIKVFFIKFACASLALKTLAAKVLNSGVVIYLLWLWLVSFFSSSLIFVSQFVFLTKLLTSGILFSTAVNADFVSNLLTSRILFYNLVSFLLLAKSVTSGFFFFLILFCLFGVYVFKKIPANINII